MLKTRLIFLVAGFLVILPGSPMFNAILPFTLDFEDVEHLTGVQFSAAGDSEFIAAQLIAKQIQPGSPAYDKGLRAGDLVSIDSRELQLQIENCSDIRQARFITYKFYSDLLYPLTSRVYTIHRSDKVLSLEIVYDSPRLLDTFSMIFRPRFIAGILLMAVALLVILVRPSDPAARLFFVANLFAYWSLTIGVLIPFTYPFGVTQVKTVIGNGSTLLTALFFLNFFLVFPRRTAFLQSFPHTLKWLYGISTAVLAVYIAAHSLTIANGTAFVLLIGTAVLFFLSGIVLMLHAYGRMGLLSEKIKMKWIMYGVCFGLTPVVILHLVPQLLWTDTVIYDTIFYYTSEYSILALILIPVCFAIAILRYRLFDIDLLFKRSLSYTLLTTVLIATYIITVLAVSALLSASYQDLFNPALAVATVAAALLINPLRNRMQSLVDRVFFYKEYDYQSSLLAFARSANGTISLVELVDIVINRFTQTMGISQAALYLLDGDELFYRLVDSRFEEPGTENHQLPIKINSYEPLVHQLVQNEIVEFPLSDTSGFRGKGFVLALTFNSKSRMIGFVLYGEKLSHLEYDEDDNNLFKTFSNQIAVAMDNALAYKQIKEMNALLEQKIKERTAALEMTLAELRTAQVQLIHTEKLASLGEMVAGIVHEINNPLSFIKANLELLRQKIRQFEANGGPSQTPVVDSSLNGVHRIEKIINELKTFSKLDETDIKEFDIHEGVEAIIAVFINQHQDRIQMHREYAYTRKILGNPRDINLAFLELLKNAVDAILSKGPSGQIWVTTRPDVRPEHDGITIEVRDDGAGIPEDIKDKIFDPFYTTKDVGEGTGMGLSEVFGIVQRHNGEIYFESQAGMGTRFTIHLPSRSVQS